MEWLYLILFALSGPIYAAGNSCQGQAPDPTAKQTMLDCATAQLAKQTSNDVAGLVDYDRKIMFLIDRKTGKVQDCAEISVGKGTGDQAGQTPTGAMITEAHHGPKYDSAKSGSDKDCVGLKGTDSQTRRRESNGVVMHKAHGRQGRNATAGCIGVADDKFDKFKKALYGDDKNSKASVIFIFDKNTREACKGGGGNSTTDPSALPGSHQ